MDPWELFEFGLSQTGRRRGDTMRRVLDALGQDSLVAETDRLELRAAALAVMARDRYATLPEADSAALVAVDSGARVGWVWYHLAEAAFALGAAEEVI